jgi:putative transposase
VHRHGERDQAAHREKEEERVWVERCLSSSERSCAIIAPRFRSARDALEMAIARRRPAAGLVHHSDQGSQYVSLRFGERCREIGIHRSVGSKGDCFDDAVAESFFATLEKDLLRRRSFATRQEARTAVFDYIEAFYNPVRLHSTLDYLSPVEYEKMNREEEKAA